VKFIQWQQDQEQSSGICGSCVTTVEASPCHWWVTVDGRSLRWADIGSWIFYPVGYLVYALALGGITGRYPYPFIDVSTLGLARVVANAVGIFAGFFLMAAALVFAKRKWGRVREGLL